MLLASIVAAALAWLTPASAAGEPPHVHAVAVSSTADAATRFAALSTRRHLLALGYHGSLAQKVPLESAPLPNASVTWLFATPAELPADVAAALGEDCIAPPVDGYALCRPSRSLVAVVGNDGAAVLWGSTALLERLGMTFGLGGVMLPAAGARPSLDTRLPVGLGERAAPAFALRGLQPFHDFAEGPDWWTADEWARVIESVAQMKGNVIHLHTYPYSSSLSTGTNEPAVWLGLAGEVNPDGTINGSAAYPTSWANTLRAEWGYNPVNTSGYPFGASSLYEHECFGHPVQSGDPRLCPWPVDPEASATVFNRVGQLWQGAFAWAHTVGVQTMLGTETPMSAPPSPAAGLLPLRTFYSPSRGDHFVTTTDCSECDGLYVEVAPPGTAGWLQSAPTAEASLPLNTYYSGSKSDNVLASSPPGGDYGLVRTEGWGVPPSTAPAPAGTAPLFQYLRTAPKVDHWALAAANASSAAAAGYVSEGTLALVYTSGPPPPDTQSFYEGAFTRLQRLLGDTLDWYVTWTPEWWEWKHVALNDTTVQQAVQDLLSAEAAHAAVGASFKMATCGWVLGPLGDRSYLDGVLPDTWSMSSIDQLVGWAPVDGNYSQVTHHQKWVIPWAEDDPHLTVPQLWLNRTLQHNADALRYGAEGLLNIHWRTRSVSPQVGASHAFAWNTSLVSSDYWLSWAAAQFGPSASAPAASIFSLLDSFNTPRPVSWVTGPGTWTADAENCALLAGGNYSWLPSFEAIRPLVVADVAVGTADMAHLEAFDYWLAQFRYARGAAETSCAWATYGAAVAAIRKISDPASRVAAARSEGYAAWSSLVSNATGAMWDLLSSVTTLGEMGTVTNVLAQSLLPNAVGPAAVAQLEALAQEPLPAALQVPSTWDPQRVPLLRVPVVRTALAAGEDLRLTALVICTPDMLPRNVTLSFAPLSAGGASLGHAYGAGPSNWTSLPMARVPGDGFLRAVYQATLPVAAIPADGLQWMVTASLPPNATAYNGSAALLPSPGASFSPGGITLTFPPARPQTVIVV